MKQPELGRKILELRQQKGLTQEELVTMCNINVRTIQRIESGEVVPRNYTVKTILHALGEDLEQFQKLGKDGQNSIPNIDFSNQLKTNNFQLHLKIAYVCGIVYFITGFLEFAGDWSRYYENDFIFGEYGYITLKLIALLCYTLFMNGFHIVGSLCDKYLLKLSSLLLIILGMVFYGYDIISIFTSKLDMEYVLISSSIFYGLAGMVFGYALLKLEEYFGVMATVTGGLTLAASFFLFTVFLSWIGLIFLIPAVLLQIIVLYKLVHYIQINRKKQ